MKKVSVSLPNAYGPIVFDDVEMERHFGNFGIWTQVDGNEKFHMLEFTDGSYRAGLPVSLESLKEIRDSIDEYVKAQETPNDL